VISPAGNFNYSTSYLFTNGPFQNSGFKAIYAFSDKVSLMAGIFNDQWNVYQSAHNPDAFGAQLFIAPVKGWTAYINLITANNSTPTSGTELDLTTAYQITNAFKLGLNAADYSATKGAGTGGFSGVALYPQLAVSNVVTLGLRGEYFKNKSGSYQSVGPAAGESVTGLTLTANIKSGPLTLIPEIRFDNGSKDIFYDRNSAPSAATNPDARSASQFVLAAVYAF
jgi:putative OmpL-like beta-barrel porin-2